MASADNLLHVSVNPFYFRCINCINTLTLHSLAGPPIQKSTKQGVIGRPTNSEIQQTRPQLSKITSTVKTSPILNEEATYQ